jgi:phage-related protein
VAVGREVAEAYIDVHGDMSSFRAELEDITDLLSSIDDRLADAFDKKDHTSRLNNGLRTSTQLLENFGKKLQGLAGLNVLEDSFRYGVQFMQNIDRNSVQLAKMVTMIGTVAGEVVHLIGSAAVLSQDIVALGGIGILAPGFLTGFGIAMGVTVAAMKDMGKVLADLKPAFAGLQDVISQAFWEQAAGPIRELVNGLMPTLNEQLRATAKAMGGLFAEFAVALKTEATPERVTIMMERLNRAIDIARGAIRPFTAAVVTLGEIGSQYFGRFAEAVVNVSNRFNDFIQRSAANGDLNRWVENAIDAFKNLGRIIEGAVGIIGAIGDAARAAGVGGLKEMADRLQAASDIMNSPRFQDALRRLFEGVGDLTDGVVRGIARLGPAFEAAMPTIQNVFGFIGQAAERVGGILAGIISNPQFLAGLQDFAASIVAALDKLAPAVKPFADSLGGLLDLMGDVLVAVAEVSSKILQEWGPIFDRMGDSLKGLVGPLKDTLLGLVDALKPIFDVVASDILPPLVDAIKELLPLVVDMVKELSPNFVKTLKDIGVVLGVVADGIRGFRDILDAMKQGGSLEWLGNVLKLFDDGTLNSVINPIMGLGSNIGKAIGEWLGGGGIVDAWNGFMGWWNDVWAGFEGFMNDAETSIETGWNDFWGGFGAGFQGFLSPILDGWNQFWADVAINAQNAWNGFVGWLATIFQPVIDAFNSFMGPVTEMWNTFWTGLSTFVQTAWAGFIQFLTDTWTNITTGIQNFATGVQTVWDTFWNGLLALPGIVWAGIQAGLQVFVDFFVTLWTSFWNGLTPQAQQVLTNIGNFISTTWNNIVTGVQNFVNTVVTNWTNFWNTVFTTAQQILSNVWNFITTTVNNIATSINNFISGVVNAWNKFWGDVFKSVNDAWNNIFGQVKTGTSNVQNNVQGFINSVVTAWNNFWNSVFQTVSNIWSNIQNFINGAINNVRNFISSGISAISSTWNSIWSSISSFASSIWNNIVSFVSNGINNARNIVSSVMNSIWSTMSSIWNSIWSTVSGAWNNISNAVSQGVNNVMAWIGQLPGRIASALGGLASQLFNAGVQMMQGMVNGIAAMAGNLVSAAQNVVGGAIDGAKRLLGIASPSKVFMKIGQQTGEGMVIGVESMGNKVAAAIGSLADAAISAIDTSAMMAAGADAAAGLAAGLDSNRDIIEKALSGIGIDLTAGASKVPVKAVASETTADGAAAAQTINQFAEGAIVQNTKVEDPTLAAKKLLDVLAGQ